MKIPVPSDPGAALRRLSGALLSLAALALAAWASDPGRYLDWRHAADAENAAKASAAHAGLGVGSGTDSADGKNPFSSAVFTGALRVVASPGGDPGAVLESAVRSAQKRVWVTVYILSDKGLRSALADAARRGVDVRLVLEGNVVGQPTINRKPAAALAAAGAKISWSDPSRFTYTHAKFLLADGAWWIGTGNFAHSSFTKNREFFLGGTDPAVLSALESVFTADAAHDPTGVVAPPLVLAPVDARAKILAVMRGAARTLDVYAQTLTDREVLGVLRDRAAAGVRVRVLLGSADVVRDNAKLLVTLRGWGIAAAAPDKPYVHAKAAVADGARAYVGSANFTANSMDRNREVGLLVGAGPAGAVAAAFQRDFTAAGGR